MTTYVFANNVSTTLAASAPSSGTTLTLASSAGLPSLSSGQAMPLTLNDAATGGVYEVVYVTNISGPTLTVERAQEGTGAQNWSVGDFAYSTNTAGTTAPVSGSAANPFSASTPASGTANNQVPTTAFLAAYYAAINGSSSQAFQVASGSASADAVNVQQMEAYAAPIPTATTGVLGTFGGIVINPGSPGSIVLPAGGTWAWFYANQMNTSSGGGAQGVSAGGSTILSGVTVSVTAGWCWRIA